MTQEQPQPLAFLKIHDLDDGMFQLVERYLHQLVTRIVLENLDHISAGVAGRGERHPLQKRCHLATQHRDPQHALVVGGWTEQAEELTFTDRPTMYIEDADGDVVQVQRPVHC